MRKKTVSSIAAALLLASAGAAHAGLLGDTVGIRYLDGGLTFGPQSVVVGPGEDGNFFQNQFYNFGDADFSIRSTGEFCGITCSGQVVKLVLDDLDFGAALTGVDLSTSLSGVSVSFTSDSATFSWTDQALHVGTYLNARFLTGSTAVPEPTSLALVGLAAAGLGVSARRRKAASAA